MKRVCLLSVCCLLAVAAAMAQTGVDGAILGVVTDANGGSVAGAMVTVRHLDTGLTKTEITHDLCIPTGAAQSQTSFRISPPVLAEIKEKRPN